MPEIVGRDRPPRLAAPPASPALGETYYDTGLNQLLYWNGTLWVGGSSWVSALNAQPILDVGYYGGIRAGRQLAVADFTAMGLSAPIALWNLGDTTDATGINDPMHSSVLDPTLWTGAYGTVTESSTGVTITNPAHYGGYGGFSSIRTFDMTGSGFQVRLVNAGNQALASWEMEPLQLTVNGSVSWPNVNALFWYLEANGLHAGYQIGGQQTLKSTISYNPSVHKWFRIREAGGAIFWDWSTDGVTWTNSYSQTAPFAVTAMNISPRCGTYGSGEASATSMIIDNLSSGHPLTNKSTVQPTMGVDGNYSTAMGFHGVGAQALHILDVGTGDPFRIMLGSFGCWFKSPWRGANVQGLIAKRLAAGNYGYELYADPVFKVWVSTNGSDLNVAVGVTDVCDDRWHFGVATYDGSMVRLYVDGVLEGTGLVTGTIFGSSAPFVIGNEASDATDTAAGVSPAYGPIDEAFITTDVLSESQIRYLYCTKISHTLGKIPAAASLKVRRQRKGALAWNDVCVLNAQPLRFYNGGSLTDTGSQGIALTNNGGALPVPGPTGARAGGWTFNAAQSLSSSDTGLPNTSNPRSYGCWFKTSALGGYTVMGWGTLSTADTRIIISSGVLQSSNGSDNVSGPFVADGQWHFVVVVEFAGQTPVRRTYLDGKLVITSQTSNPVTLVGANGFRIGANSAGTGPFVGQTAAAFVINDAMTQTAVAYAYARGGLVLPQSVKDSGAHIEAMDASNIYATFDTLETQHLIDLAVS